MRKNSAKMKNFAVDLAAILCSDNIFHFTMRVLIYIYEKKLLLVQLSCFN